MQHLSHARVDSGTVQNVLAGGRIQHIPDNYTNLNEIRAPSPVESSSDRQSDTLESQLSASHTSKEPEGEESQDSSGQETALSQSGHESQEDYTIPNDYANLDELAAPSPVDTRRSQQQRHLEDRSLDLKDASSRDQATTPSIKHNRQGDNSLIPRPEANHAAEPPPPNPPNPTTQQNPPQPHLQVSKPLTELYTISYLIFFSILGTLARLGLQALTFYPGAPVQTGVLWANVGGSLLMGFLSEDRNLFRDGWGPTKHEKQKKTDDAENGVRTGHDDDNNDNNRRSQNYHHQYHTSIPTKKEHATIKKTIPLYIGLTTGFCGSFTSFSSFIRDAFLALSNTLPAPPSTTLSPFPSSSPPPTPTPRAAGYSFLATTAILITTLSLSLSALQVGAHLALALEPYTPSVPFPFTRRIVDRTLVLVAWGCWLGAVLLAIFPPDRPPRISSWARESWRGQALFALVFAPLGCLLRFYAAVRLNGKRPAFPLGTFAVNMLGTAMEGGFFALQHVTAGNGHLGCQVLQGLMDGFCGSATTVSTFVVEMKGLRLRHAYFYGVGSVGGGLAVAVVIMGGVQWSVGFKEPACRH